MPARQIQLAPLQSPGYDGRLALALLLSINLHLYLVYGIVPESEFRPDAGRQALTARLELAAVETSEDSAPATPVDTPRDAATPDRALELDKPVVPILEPPRTESQRIVAALARRAFPAPDMAATAEPASPQPVLGPVPPIPTQSTQQEKSGADFAASINPHYFSATEIDRYPRLLRKVAPTNPNPTNAVPGIVTLRLFIDDAGIVTNASVANSDLPNVFDEPALAAFRFASFAPAQINGVAVHSQILVKVHFDADHTESSSR